LQVLIPPDISEQSDYIVLQISQEAIQSCDTSKNSLWYWAPGIL